ncbi:MAG: DNA translocase FtsK 4TM domain-containing protein [Thermodesulfobacteriota bacterium]
MASKANTKKNNSKKAKTPSAPDPGVPRPRRLGQEMTAVLLLGLAVFLLLSLWTWTLKDPQSLTELWQAHGVRNWGGKAGAILARYLLVALGLAAFWLPLCVIGLAWKSYRSGLDDLSLKQGIALGGMMAASAGLLALGWPLLRWGDWSFPSGGYVGVLLARGLPRLLNPSGAALALALLLLISIMSATRLSYLGLLSLVGRIFTGLWSLIWRRRREPEPPLLRVRRTAPPKPVVNRSAGETPEVVMGPVAPPAPESGTAAPKTRKGATAGGFTLPPLDLLDQVPPWDQQVHEGVMVAQAEKLEDTLRHFGVEGKVASIITGPVVSRFELEPAPGVKISKVTGLADDLALALKAISIRIVAPVPGKAVIGIEIPNPKRQVVGLREILADAAYRKSSSRLTIALGKDIMGQSVVNDLAKMPHLLIAGATGSGKSVGLNAMILSILFKATPQEVRFLLIDPKRIELSNYEGIPHLLHPVVVNPKEATVALHWAVAEMERRYALLSDMGVRNIDGYNQKIAKNAKEKPPEGEDPPRPLPYIVIVIDELADLMLLSSRDTEEYLIRLAQKARASGVHLLVATQRPSVDVITGLIKANFPTRISYQVSAKPDSRVILDTVGAERLLGMGDLLFLPPGTSRLRRIHGAFVSDEEVARVVEFLKAQQTPEFEPGILEMQEREVEEGEAGEKDEKWDAAVELVAETRNASISMLQRRLRIGYNRAARIIETMEQEGLIGPSDGLKAREVYIPRR